MEPVDPVPGWSVPPQSLPPHPEGRRWRIALIALISGAVAVVLLGVVGVTAVLVGGSDSEPTALRAKTDSATPSAETVAPGAPGAPVTQGTSGAPGTPVAESDAGQAAADRPHEPSSSTGAPPRAGTPATTGPAAPAPAPTSKAPAPAPAPVTKAPTTKAPATKAPATKKPTTKAPTPNAPEINKAVAKSGTRGAGPCSAKLAAGYGCLQTYGDIWWVYDTKADSHSAVVFWEVGSGTAKRTGQCANSMGNGKIGACNKNYAEKTKGRAKVCIMDWDTKKVWQCTAYFSFTTG